MGIRQTAQPLGIALGAVVIPELGERSAGAGLMFPALACTVSAVAAGIGVVDPPRKSLETASDEELSNPYRRTSVLRRIHAASALLMMPQTMTVTFMLVWLINNHGWEIESAGALVTVSQLLGALGRVIAGRWSDRVGSRLRPVRTVAVAGGLALLLLAFTDNQGWAIAVGLMIIASVIAALDNGLESVAITEYAGPFWSGRALGAQNTFQRLAAATGPPLFGAVITAAGYPAAFALCGLFPLAAAPLVPASVVPPGLEIRARWRSVRRHRRWRAVRSLDRPESPPQLDQHARRRRLRRHEKAATPRT
jgi:MFS family permease